MSSANLLFHNLLELLSIFSTLGCFILIWKSRGVLRNNYLLVVGAAFLCVGCLEIAHVVTNNMAAFGQNYSHNVHIQLWVAARYVENCSLLVAPFLIGRRIHFPGTVGFYAVLAALLLGSIFYWKIFPDCYIQASGLTNFEIDSEYVLSQMLVVSLGLLLWRYGSFDRRVLLMLGAAMVSSMSSEISFSPYMKDYRFPNIAGHIFLVVSYILVFRAISLARRYSSVRLTAAPRP
jgi:hypothetical protein